MQKKILVLDDEDVICEVLEEELSAQGYSVRTTCTGSAALRAIKEESFALLLVDLKLPVRPTGIEVIKWFKDRCPDAKVLVMTGYPDPALEHDALVAGADGYLNKPGDIQPGNIVKHVKKILNG